MYGINIENLEKLINEKFEELLREEVKKIIEEKFETNKCEICKDKAEVLIPLCEKCYRKWQQKKNLKNK